MCKRTGGKMPLALLLCLLLRSVSAETDPLDVEALQELYGALNNPPQLKGWRFEGGDPCRGEPWLGVFCSGKSVTSIRIKGMGIGGHLSSELANFKSLNELDVSNNAIGGDIPDSLPPNATHLDLSFNNFSGDLPSSFRTLTHLRALYLQENQFTGSVNLLVNLPLSVLNIENNHFGGFVPKEFESIQELRIGGNMFETGYTFSPPHIDEDSHPSSSSPLSSMAPNCNAILSTSDTCSHSSSKIEHKQEILSPWAAAGAVCGIFLVALVAALIIIFNHKSPRTRCRGSKRASDSFNSLPVTTLEVSGFSKDYCISESLSMTAPRPPSIHHPTTSRVSKRKISSRRVKSPSVIKLYSASDLLTATNGFNEKNLLGQNLFGSVYRADFPDGQTCVVKKLEMSELSMIEEDMFTDFVWNISHLKHPNITRLLGFSVEQGQHILVYEYIRNGSLDDILHCSHGAHKIISWRSRVKIALGVARALEYLHWTFCPPIAHENLKATNILLDDKLTPHLSDCGLTRLRPLINTMPKTSKVAVGYTGYNAPESGIPGIDKTRNDVYSFGVLLLEILTGRKPFDSSKGKQEQSLVRWASYHLHDIGLLEGIADPAIKCTITSKALSQFADIILLCIQPEPKFRPLITEVADILVRLVHKMRHHPCKRKLVKEAGVELDVSEMSYETSFSHFESTFPVAN